MSFLRRASGVYIVIVSLFFILVAFHDYLEEHLRGVYAL